MPDTKNLCAHIPIELHRKVTAAKTVAGLNINDYVTQVLAEYYEWKENGGTNMARENGKERTLAFQISEELFQRIKAHLERETRRLGYKVTQKDFVIGLIEAALAEAEQEAEGASNGTGEAEQEAEQEGGTINGGTDEAAQESEQLEERREEQQDGDREPNAAPEETAQEAPCEDGVPSEDGVASQPTENC